jgi:cytochrome b6-f complex iron-sulfur subunit
MEVTRRHLIVLTAAALSGCARVGDQGTPLFVRGPVDAGELADYPHDGIFARFRDSHGFFIVRDDNHLLAQTAICTHRACKIRATENGFLCPCHGSTFDLSGAVTRGPARRNLPRFAVERDSRLHLIVHTDQLLSPDQFRDPAAFIAL